MPVIWETPLTEEQTEKIIERVAAEVKKRRLETPAILFLEMHKPLANVAAHAAVAFSPFLMPFLGFKTVDEYSQFISNRDNIERLIRRLEERDAEQAEGKGS